MNFSYCYIQDIVTCVIVVGYGETGNVAPVTSVSLLPISIVCACVSVASVFLYSVSNVHLINS